MSNSTKKTAVDGLERLQRFISKENKLLVFLKTIRTWRAAKIVVGNRVNWS